MCPILAGVLWIVTKSFDNEYAGIADVARALVIISNAKARCKQRLKTSTAGKPRTRSLCSTNTTSSRAVVLELLVNSHILLCTLPVSAATDTNPYLHCTAFEQSTSTFHMGYAKYVRHQDITVCIHYALLTNE